MSTEIISNRLGMVSREYLHGNIQGVWWGYNASCIARSPDTILLWSSGSPYTSGRQTHYGRSHLTALTGMSPHWGHHPKWVQIGPDGGRLNVTRIADAAEHLSQLFGDDAVEPLLRCIKERKTLLIEGGGTEMIAKRIR
jgi:hypothetical protein